MNDVNFLRHCFEPLTQLVEYRNFVQRADLAGQLGTVKTLTTGSFYVYREVRVVPDRRGNFRVEK